MTDDNQHRKPASGRRRAFRAVLAVVLFLLLLLPAAYIGVQQAMLSRIQRDLVRSFGTDYAILKLHVNGENRFSPSLLKMLRQAFEYRFLDEYRPEGSDGLTGKKFYLTMLVSDNRRIGTCNWSFRRFRLDVDVDDSPWNLIDIFPRDIAPKYRYTTADLIRKQGLRFSARAMDDPEVSFYSHGVDWGLEGFGAMAPNELSEAERIRFFLERLRYPSGPADDPGGRDWYAAYSGLGFLGDAAIPPLFEKLEAVSDPHDRMLILATIGAVVWIDYPGGVWHLEHLDRNMRLAQDWYRQNRQAGQTQVSDGPLPQ